MFEDREQRRLNRYSKEIKRIVKLGKKLNTKQKVRMNFYANRILAYCTNRTIICSKNERLKDAELISDDEQAIVYKEIFDRLNNIAIRISEDDILSLKTKKELGISLKSLIGHVRGKQNINNKYAKKYQIFGYINAKSARDFCEQEYLIKKFVKENKLSLDAIYVDDNKSQTMHYEVNFAIDELNKKILNESKQTVVIMSDFILIILDENGLLELWKQKNVKMIVL